MAGRVAAIALPPYTEIGKSQGKALIGLAEVTCPGLDQSTVAREARSRDHLSFPREAMRVVKGAFP